MNEQEKPDMNPEEDLGEIFTVVARRCKRCGGLLTSKDAVKNGYGHTCLRKTKHEEEAQKILDGQITLFDERS